MSVHQESWPARYGTAMSRLRDAQAEFARASQHVLWAQDAVDLLRHEAAENAMKALTEEHE